jgi:hypothetical protein
VMSRYCRAVDDRDFDQFDEILSDDVRFEMGDVTESRAQLLEYMQENLWPPGRHLYMNPSVTVEGDSAHVDSDWVWLDPSFAVGGVGRYSDDFRREDGRWVIAVRRISMNTRVEASRID